jgi:RNA polymerase sigma factor (sigma-70 family)
LNERRELARDVTTIADARQERERAALDATVTRAVRFRFSMDAGDFAQYLQGLIQPVARNAGRSLAEHAALLSLDDLYLASACLQGDERAWNEFSRAHFDFMREFARRFLPVQAARDVADEIIAELWTRGRLKQYEGRSTLRTWLGAVVAHAALNSRKSLNRLVPLEEHTGRPREPADTAASHEPASEEAAALLRDLLGEAIRTLDAEDRLTLQLYYEQGMTLDELSLLLRASSAAVSRRLKRTRESLRAALEAISRRRTGESADSLRSGLDLSRIELDLGRLLGNRPSAQEDRGGIV